MRPWVEVAVSSMKEGLIITAIQVPICIVAGLVLGMAAQDIMGFLLLIESVILMLIGGATELGGTASVKRLQSLFSGHEFEWNSGEYKRIQSRGAFFSLMGVLFFVESLALALATIAY